MIRLEFDTIMEGSTGITMPTADELIETLPGLTQALRDEITHLSPPLRSQQRCPQGHPVQEVNELNCPAKKP